MIQSICVCGAGTMGSGIAQAAAQHGFKVILYDVDEQMLIHARQQINRSLQSLVEKQKISAIARDAIIDNLRYEHDYRSCKADVIIEAIIEKIEIKKQLFSQLTSVNNSNTIFATNTSSLPVTEIAESHPQPGKLVGMHFFNPATIMKLVEVVKTKHSDENAVQSVMQLARSMGKVPVLCKDSPGFIVNRVARPFYIEALRLAEEGVPMETIDVLMESAGFKMGPFRLMDLIGNDVNYAVSTSVYEQLGSPERLKPSYLQQQNVDEGRLGRKTGAGFYDYQ